MHQRIIGSEGFNGDERDRFSEVMIASAIVNLHCITLN